MLCAKRGFFRHYSYCSVISARRTLPYQSIPGVQNMRLTFGQSFKLGINIILGRKEEKIRIGKGKMSVMPNLCVFMVLIRKV